MIEMNGERGSEKSRLAVGLDDDDKYIYPIPPHEQDVTKGKFLSRV